MIFFAIKSPWLAYRAAGPGAVVLVSLRLGDETATFVPRPRRGRDVSDRDAPERLTWEGVVTADGDCVYINGMILVNVLRAAFPPESGRDGYYNYGRLTVTIVKDQP